MKNSRPFTLSKSIFSVAASLTLVALPHPAVFAENLTILHVGDQESWLLSAQGNLRDDASQTISFYGGVDRLATVLNNAQVAAQNAGRTVIKLNAGDSLLPGPRFSASFANLATAYNGGQDFYDAIALRLLDFDATVFGNHEFDLGVATAARFAEVSENSYLSINLDFTQNPALNALQNAGKVGASKVITTPGGKKIGIVGVTTPLLPTISSPETLALMNGFAGFSTANSELQNLQAVIPVVQAEIDALRAPLANGGDDVDVVIVMSHLQNANNERTILVPGLTGVDLVVSGGGHELMTDPDDLLINGGVAATFVTHPIFANDAAAQPVPIVTGHFGNRYLGEVNATIDDTTGDFTLGTTRMLRVSGRTGDPDRVVGDPTLVSTVITPVSNYISAQNAQILGTTGIRLNADRAGASNPNYAPGIRKSETNLGNLVADANRFAGGAEVAIQNGGGVRTSVAGPGNLSVGDTFNVLPFTNLIKTALAMNATQLKDILEHGVGGTNTNPNGGEEGRFPQVAGMKVFYDTSAARVRRTTIGTGDRVRRVVLDDGTVLIDNGAVVNNTRTFSFATIDFTANGGDGYPFAANNVVFENTVFTITYQEALKELIETPKADGGLQRLNAADGDEVTSNMYGTDNPQDLHGRLIDLAVGVANAGPAVAGTAARETITGTAADNVITGGGAGDTITGGAGGDIFVYTNVRDAGDIVTDFTPYADKVQLTALLASLGITSPNPVASGHVKIVDGIGGVSVQYDTDGNGPAPARPLLTLRGLVKHQIVAGRDFIF